MRRYFSMISFRRSISCALERCSSSSLCCAITSAFNASISSAFRSGRGEEIMAAVCHEDERKSCPKPASIQGNHTCHLHCNLGRPGPLRTTPIDAFQKHRQLRSRQTNSSFRSLRPYETTLLQTLGEKTKTIAIEP